MSFDPKRWDTIELIESQRAELKAFADERGFVLQAGRGVVHEGGEFLALWMAWGEGTAAKRYPTVEGSLRAWPEPITEVHYPNFGYLTEVDFVRNRSAGWEKSAAIMVAHNEAAIGLDKDEQALRLREAVQRQQEVEERTREKYREAYRKAVDNRLDDQELIADQHIAALDIRVNRLRRHLEKVGNHLLEEFGSGALDWLYVASALAEQKRQSITRDEWPRGSIEDQILHLHVGFGYGTSPDLMMNQADTLLRHELGLPEVIIFAQLSGLVFLLNSREPHLREATYLRDKLSTYELLLFYAVVDESPLSEEALEAVEEIQAERGRRGSPEVLDKALSEQEHEEIIAEYERRMQRDKDKYRPRSGALVSDLMKDDVGEALSRPSSTVGDHVRKYLREGKG